ncbi:MAG: hypothetical protein AAF327_21990 [Cyanobacteria bacterium P01_A01_bin.37]
MHFINKRLQRTDKPCALRVPLGKRTYLQLPVSSVQDADRKLEEFRQAEIELAMLHNDADFFDRN